MAAPNFRGSYRDILQVRACLKPIQSFTIFESFLASQKSISLVTPFNPNPLPLFLDAKHDNPPRRRLAHSPDVYIAPPSPDFPPVVSDPVEPTVSNFESINRAILNSTSELIQNFKDPSYRDELFRSGITPPVALLKVSCNFLVPKGSPWIRIPVEIAQSRILSLNDTPFDCKTFEVRNAPGPDDGSFTVQTSEISFCNLSLSHDPLRNDFGPPSGHIFVRNITDADHVITENEIVASLHRPPARSVAVSNEGINIRELAFIAASSEYVESVAIRSNFLSAPDRDGFSIDFRPIILFLGHSNDVISTFDDSISSDGQRSKVVAVISQKTGFSASNDVPVFHCKGDLVSNTPGIISFLNSELSNECIRASTIFGFMESSLSNSGEVESRSQSGCKRLVETTMALGIASALLIPFIGFLDSDMCETVTEIDNTFSTLAYPSSESSPQHLRGYAIVSNSPLAMPADCFPAPPLVTLHGIDRTSTLTSPYLSVSGSIESGPYPDLRSEIFQTSDPKPPQSPGNFKRLFMSKSQKETATGYASGGVCSDRISHGVRLSIPPKSHLKSLALTFSKPSPLTTSDDVPQVAFSNFASLTDDCLSSLKTIQEECRATVNPDPDDLNYSFSVGKRKFNDVTLSQISNKSPKINSHSLRATCNLSAYPHESHDVNRGLYETPITAPLDPSLSDVDKLDAPPDLQFDPRGLPRLPMSDSEVDALFEKCPFSGNIPKSIVPDFKKDCILNLRELWQTTHLPPVLGTECHIPVTKIVNARPIPCHNREKLTAFRAILQSMVDRGVITPSDSPYNSPAFLVPKKDPKSDDPNHMWRLVNDLSAVNAHTLDFRNDPPQIDCLISALAGSNYFSSTDAVQSFWQLPLDKKSREVTAFTVPPLQKFEFTRLPMGAKLSTTFMQSHMYKVLKGIELSSVVFFVDDVLMHSKGSARDHLKIVTRVLRRMWRFGHTLHLLKCTFFASEITFLGYTVNKDGFMPDSKLVQGISSLPIPRSVKGLQVSLGMFQYQSKFLKDFAFDINALRTELTDATAKGLTSNFEISLAAKNSFLNMKSKIESVIINKQFLYFPKWDRKLFIETDASKVAVGGWAYQFDISDAKLSPKLHAHLIRPVAFFSRKLKVHERKWCLPSGSTEDGSNAAQAIVEKFRNTDFAEGDLEYTGAMDLETLGIVFALDTLDYLLESFREVIVLTDHKNIVWLLAQKNIRRVRWALRLSAYHNLSFLFQRGSNMLTSDCLSRLVNLNEEAHRVTSSSDVSTPSVTTIFGTSSTSTVSDNTEIGNHFVILNLSQSNNSMEPVTFSTISLEDFLPPLFSSSSSNCIEHTLDNDHILMAVAHNIFCSRCLDVTSNEIIDPLDPILQDIKPCAFCDFSTDDANLWILHNHTCPLAPAFNMESPDISNSQGPENLTRAIVTVGTILHTGAAQIFAKTDKLPMPSTDVIPMSAIFDVTNLPNRRDILDLQSRCDFCNFRIQFLLHGIRTKRKDKSKSTRSVFNSIRKDFEYDKALGILFRRPSKKTKSTNPDDCVFIRAIVIPPLETRTQNSIADFFHSSLEGGHGFYNSVIFKTRGYFWWPGLDATVRKVCTACKHCKASKSYPSHNAPQFPIYRTAHYDTLHIDIFRFKVPGSKIIGAIVVYDAFNHFVRGTTITNESMELAAEWLFFEVFLKCGKPNHLIFDTQFDVIEVNSILKVLSILGSKSWSYVHNGVAAERIIKFLLEAIRTMVSFAKSKTGINMNHLAPNLFYYAMAAYNSSPIPGTNGITPFFHEHGRHYIMPGIDSDIQSIDRLENLPTIGLSESALLRRDLLLTISKNLKRIHSENSCSRALKYLSLIHI